MCGDAWFARYGLSLLLFLAASLVACTLGHWFVKYMLVLLSERAIEKQSDMTHGRHREEVKKLLAEFDPKFAGIVGGLERVFYIYSVMRGELALVAGWLVLKAFFPLNYIHQPPDGHVLAARMRRYHIYILASGLSLLMGLACGTLALIARVAICGTGK
jgi:hypothetical protein